MTILQSLANSQLLKEFSSNTTHLRCTVKTMYLKNEYHSSVYSVSVDIPILGMKMTTEVTEHPLRVTINIFMMANPISMLGSELAHMLAPCEQRKSASTGHP